jgi:hypothetical protein
VKRLNSAHPGLAREASGDGRRQMRAFYRQCRIRLRKSGFDEQQIGVLGEPDDGRAIFWRVGGVSHISHLLTGRDRQHGAQCAERQLAHIR